MTREQLYLAGIADHDLAARIDRLRSLLAGGEAIAICTVDRMAARLLTLQRERQRRRESGDWTVAS